MGARRAPPCILGCTGPRWSSPPFRTRKGAVGTSSGATHAGELLRLTPAKAAAVVASTNDAEDDREREAEGQCEDAVSDRHAYGRIRKPRPSRQPHGHAAHQVSHVVLQRPCSPKPTGCMDCLFLEASTKNAQATPGWAYAPVPCASRTRYEPWNACVSEEHCFRIATRIATQAGRHSKTSCSRKPKRWRCSSTTRSSSARSPAVDTRISSFAGCAVNSTVSPLTCH